MAFSLAAAAQTYVYTEASALTLVAKLIPGEPTTPHHRVDTLRYEGFTPTENCQVRMTSGMGCVCRTDSKSLRIKTEYGQLSFPTNTNGFSARGYDLYIRKDGESLFAAAGVASDKKLY